jgi:signal transduction histidine kinase
MGSHGRSIRLRIYFLVAIPLIAMAGLLAYVAGSSINNAINLDRGPNLINATSLPTAQFVSYLQSERAAAVIYLFQPTPGNLTAYNAAAGATARDQPAFLAAMHSPGTTSSATASETQGINAMIAGLSQLPDLRGGVTKRAVTPIQALEAYTAVIENEPKLFLAEADSLTNATAAGQALGLIASVSTREALSEEYALLSGMLAGNRMSQTDRAAFAVMAATREGDLLDANSVLSPANAAIFNAQLNKTYQTDLTEVEGAVSASIDISKVPITAAQWNGLATQVLAEYYTGGVNVANAELVADRQISHQAWVKVGIICGIALVGLLVTIFFTIFIGRGIIRRLRGLEHTALTLAENQLPDVIARLRRGENVDVASEAPPLRVGGDEIGRVGQAFDLVRQTAIRSAVEESRLRQGLNDVFRSLARRSQSLLHRQLTLLDQMERRATDPEALDDLFRLDHLTTRMRRHAEGLVILAGAPPGRGWSSPVRMVDVMRGAIAEVEDYARVAVATRSQAALSGSAVADVIHLLAELIENAATLSPPYTSVRVSGDTVANGFAIEVEDRGLGMNSQRLAELNERLASPPEFNPSDSEQLGLFVVSQLAKRHGIRVTLKASPYGGTAAIVLIPRQLVVTEESFRSGLPGEPAAITMTPMAANGHDGAATDVNGPGAQPVITFPELRGLPGPPAAGPSAAGAPGPLAPDPLAPGPLAPGIRISGPLRRSQGIPPENASRGTHAAGQANGGTASRTGADGLPRRHDPAGPASPANGAGRVPFADAGSPSQDNGLPAFDVFMPQRRPDDDPAGPETGLGPEATQPNRALSPSHPADASSYPGSGSATPAGAWPFSGASSAPYPDEPAPFPGWTNVSSGRGGANAASQATPATPDQAGNPSSPPWELSRQTGPLTAVPGGIDPESQPGENGDIKGLPRRVRQASLAPQLRANPPQRRVITASSGPANGPTPAEIRQSMSALQRGWQEGRSQRAEGLRPGEPPRVPGDPSLPSGGEPGPPADVADAGPSASTSPSAGDSLTPDASSSPAPDSSTGAAGGHDSIADDEARGGSDGT